MLTEVRAALERLLPAVCKVESSAVSSNYLADLYAEEWALIADASELRQAEFATGRALARRLFRYQGLAPLPVLVGTNRMPLWPEGFVGSISHSSGVCAVAVAPNAAVSSLGIDIEDATPLEPELWELVGTSDEITLVEEHLANPQRGLAAKVLFSAKEAAFKCWYPSGQSLLEFSDATLFRQRDAEALLGLNIRGKPFLSGRRGHLTFTIAGSLIVSTAVVFGGATGLDP